MVKQEATPTGNMPPSVPLPPDHVIHQFTTSERRILYDYIVEVGEELTIIIKMHFQLVVCAIGYQPASFYEVRP